MNKEEQLHRLLRLKRHEHPPEAFAAEFLAAFQRRQRVDIVRRSALSIVWERLAAWGSGLRRPAVLWTAGLAYAGLMLTLWLLPRHPPGSDLTVVVGTENIDTAPAPHRSLPRTTPVSTGQSGATGAIPGKRRTIPQPQEKENIIGPESKTGDYQAPPLREL